jgi:hypothetical protein
MRTTVSLTPAQVTLARVLVTTEGTIRRVTYKRAQTLTALNDSGLSVRDLVTVATDLGVADLGKTRIAVLIKAYRAAAEGAPEGTPDQATFEATLKDQTDANREAGKAAREAKAAAEGEATGEASPTGDSATRPATVADAIAVLSTLVATFGTDPAFRAALTAAAEGARVNA